MSDRPDRATDPATTTGRDEAAPASASSGDSGREAQPASAGAVERDAERVEQLERHSRSMDDDTGINPTRTQSTTGQPDEPNDTDPPPAEDAERAGSAGR